MTAHASSVTYRWVALLMAVVAVLGWGLFFMISTSAASVEDAQRIQIARLAEERDRLEAEIREQRSRATQLADLEAKLATARDNLARTTEAIETARTRYDEARAALASTQSALSAQRVELASAEAASDAQSRVAERTGTIERAKPRRKRWSRRRRHR
jgi:septal ring factor EnvC (AmiA/AmiB activator)